MCGQNVECIPEYNPAKFKRAAKVSKVVSILCLIIMCVGIAWILGKAFLDDNAFLVSVNGVPQKQWTDVIMLTGVIGAVFGLLSVFAFMLHVRLKWANAIFSEPDEKKRLAMCMRNQRGTQRALDIATACATKEFIKKG